MLFLLLKSRCYRIYKWSEHYCVQLCYPFQSTDFRKTALKKTAGRRQRARTLYVQYISIILTPTPCVVPVVCCESYEPDGL